MNLTYINVTFTGKVLRWKLYLQDKDFDLYKEEHKFVPDALSRLCENHRCHTVGATRAVQIDVEDHHGRRVQHRTAS